MTFVHKIVLKKPAMQSFLLVHCTESTLNQIPIQRQENQYQLKQWTSFTYCIWLSKQTNVTWCCVEGLQMQAEKGKLTF